MWRGGLGAPYLFPTLSSVGASLGSPCSVSTSRSSNRTGGSPASGSRRRRTLSPTESCVSVCPDEQDPSLHRDVCPGTSRLHVLRAYVSFATTDAASSSRNRLQRDRPYRLAQDKSSSPIRTCAVELGHYCYWIQRGRTPSGHFAYFPADAVHPLSRWNGAKIGSSSFGAIALTKRVSKKVKLLFRQSADPRLRVVHRQLQLRHHLLHRV